MATVLSLDNKKVEDIELPEVFAQKLNSKTLHKAFLAEESKSFQLKYTDPLAGKRKVGELTKRRRSYKTVYGRGYTRTPKKILSRNGTQFNYVGAIAPHTVGGRQAHPPKAEKVLVKEINKKERALAIKMGIAASVNKDLVSKYHRVESLQNFPIIVDDKLNDIAKTKELEKTLYTLGLGDEVSRITSRKIRPGKGKLRGRKYKRKLGLVIVTSDTSKIKLASGNLNIKSLKPEQLSVSDVSNSGEPGRLIVWTKSAVASFKKQ